MSTPERGLVRPVLPVRPLRIHRTQREPEVYTLQIDIWEDVPALELVYHDNQDPAAVARLWLDSHNISHPEAYEGLIRLIIRHTGGQMIEDTIGTAVLSAAPAQPHISMDSMQLRYGAKWPTQAQRDKFAVQVVQTPAVRTASVTSEQTLEERNVKLEEENAKLIKEIARLMELVSRLSDNRSGQASIKIDWN
ncbi:hypothetical protein LTR56_023542 [Elasticomyces elasticus]|nr:hypothetical protein LTR56_023542 [Elasticomyces elasticus]KAK3649130.1 hypothetical protein LTR22_013100 [Elasticomyces elasticus]KAK4930007.1 hypothetical protein LTR49_003334 [Elasticomyces elasticus]KAK5745628.1 hypothetical protein LTS12_023016 [Elasticomyces elasticus]